MPPPPPPPFLFFSHTTHFSQNVKLVHGDFFVVSLQPGRPAALSAEIYPGDALVKINKTDTRGLSLAEVVGMLTGKIGAKVTLFIRRLAGDTRPVCVELAFALNIDKSGEFSHGGAVVASTRPASSLKQAKSGAASLSEMRQLQSQVLGQLGVRKAVGYTGQTDFLKRRHGLGK